MGKLLYFAYGSNLHPNWLRSRTPSAEIICSRERIRHYRLLFNKYGLDDSGKCNIIPSETAEDEVYGAIYAFDAAEKGVLDEAERGYREARLQIGEYEDVLVYIADDFTPAHSPPYTWYRDIVVAGAELHALPADYIERIRSFTAITDADLERERRHRAISGVNS